jgi:branched-chain amino acid transport system permease protein
MIEWMAANAPALRNMSSLALLGYSVHLALRSGVFNFASVGFYAIGGYLSANLLKLGWNWVLILVVVVAAAHVLAYLLSPILTRLHHLYLAMATLAFTLFIQSVALSWPTFTGGAQGLFGIPRALPQLPMLGLVILVVLLVWLSQRGPLGRSTSALRHDELLSASLGVDVRKQQAAAFAGSSVVGSLAGFVQVATTGVFGPENIGFGVVVSSLTVVVVGGALYWLGPLVGAVLVGLLPLVLRNAGVWNLILQSVIVLAIVVYQPSGVVGIVRRAASGLRRLTPAKHDQSEEKKEVPVG